ncbi:hypothetical protein KGF57_000394 [Candida theae]|uniref:Ribophorin II C-terminal domain-containing protein n=1 Tax=Candida theae TaxID=1198502 RepID=A0AAD5BJL5_9ASCO|nr:uncharacterized protein KGF57_000394 [Candida theae]KAI5967451.1 hypothetical protein KGF57_000394 [Candida theae]
MKFTSTVSILTLAISTLSYGAITGTISSSGKTVHYGEIETQEIKVLPLESIKDTIDIKLKNDKLDGQPEQIMLSLSDSHKSNVATHYIPVVNGNNIKYSIKANSIPATLLSRSQLTLGLVIADSKTKSNLVKRLVDLKPSAELKKPVKQERKFQFGLQPEIHHIFKEDAKTVNPVVPVAFIAVAAATFLILLGSWAGFIGLDNLFSTLKSTSGGQLLQNVSFLLTLIGFEFNFVKYYLGQSIFTTLFYGSILALAAVYFGSSVLRYLAQNRALGKQ